MANDYSLNIDVGNLKYHQETLPGHFIVAPYVSYDILNIQVQFKGNNFIDESNSEMS